MNAPNQKTKYTPQEFLGYLLLYAAHADAQFNEEERIYILSKIEQPAFDKMFEEFAQENDYQRVQRVIAFRKSNPGYSSDFLVQEFKALFLSDNHFHPVEKLMLSTIRQLFTIRF